MRREERVTVQGPVKEQQPDGMSHGGGGVKRWVGGASRPTATRCEGTNSSAHQRSVPSALLWGVRGACVGLGCVPLPQVVSAIKGLLSPERKLPCEPHSAMEHLQALRRLAACKTGFNAFSALDHFNRMAARLVSWALATHNDGVIYAAVDLLLALMHPMHDNYDLAREQACGGCAGGGWCRGRGRGV